MLWNCCCDARPDIFQSSGCDLGGDLVDSPDFLNDCVRSMALESYKSKLFPAAVAQRPHLLNLGPAPDRFL